MSPLLKTYIRIGAPASAFAVFLNTITVKFVEPYLTKQSSQYINPEIALFLLSLGIIYSLAFVMPLKFYETVLWQIMHPRLRFGGYWQCTVTYDACERGAEKLPDDFVIPKTFIAVIEIQQTPFQLGFESGFTEANEKWWVRMAEIVGEDLFYVYESERSLPAWRGFAPRVLGFDRASVTRRSFFGFPMECKSLFYQCCLPTYPLFRGHTVWKRLTKKQFHEAQSGFNGSAGLPASGEALQSP